MTAVVASASARIFFTREPADVKQQHAAVRNPKLRASRRRIVRRGFENSRIHAEVDIHNIRDAPFLKQRAERWRWHERARETVVKMPHVAPREVHCELGRGLAEKLRDAA